MRLFALSAILVGIPSNPAFPQEKQPEQLVEQLGSPRFNEREVASRLLMARGSSALPALRKALTSKDAEIRQRAEKLIAVIEIAAALEPRRLGLNAVNQPLAVIVKEIEKQTSYKIDLDAQDSEKTCSLDLKREPFWTALERIRSETGVSVLANDVEKSVKVRSRPGHLPFVSIDGPFRVVLTQLHEDKDIDFAAALEGSVPNRTDWLTMTLLVQAEPKLLLLALGTPELETSCDENGKPFKIAEALDQSTETRMIRHFARGVKQRRQIVEVLMRRPTDKSTRIKELRGFLTATVVIERKRVLVTDDFVSAKGKKFDIGRDSLEITGSEHGDQGRTVDLRIRIPKPPEGIDLRWHDRVHVEDAVGNPVHRSGSGSGHAGDDYHISVYHCQSDNPKSGPPAKLFIEEWRIIEHRIPFTYKNVPLP